MASFKPYLGKKQNLPSTKTEGSMYVCADDGTAYIDYKDENGTLQRRQLAGLMSSADKSKLDGIATGANNYTLPAAGGSLGGVKTGGDVTISNGVITVNDDSHAHVISNVDGLQTALNGKASTSVATTSANGLMSSTDKSKLDGIATGANKYTLPAAGSSLGGVKSGGDVTISEGTITVNDDSHNHIISNVDGLQTALDGKASTSTATTSANGLMSSSDKTKLNGIATGANNYSHPTTSGNKHIPSGGSSGQILRWSSDGTAVWGSDNNTTYSNATTSAAGLMSASDKSKLDGIATGANKTTVDTSMSSSSTNPVQNKVVQAALDGKVSKRENGYSYNNLASCYTGGSAPSYYRIKFPDSVAPTWTMLNIEISIRQHYTTENGGKILINAHHSNTSTAWSINAATVGNLTLAIKVYASDGKYIYITGCTDYSTISIDKILVGDSATSLDISGISIDIVDALPTTYQTATMHYGINSQNFTSQSAATTSTNGLMSSTDKSKLDGIATGANKYSHPTTSGNKHIPSGGSSGQILRWSADGTAVWGADNNTTYSNATTSTAGLMSKEDKSKLDGIATGANKYTHPTYTARIGKPTANATPAFGGTFTVSQITSDATGHVTGATDRTITIPSAVATTSAAGLMSASDKSKLNGIATGANKTTVDTAMSSSSTNPVQNKVVQAALNGKSNTSHTHNTVIIPDTRDESWTPLQYMSNYPKQVITEFKTASVVGLSGTTYTKLTTYVNWGDNSGGYPSQEAIINGKLYIRQGTSDTVWSAWKELADADEASESAAGLMSATDKAKLNGIATGANKYSHPKYTAKSSGLYKVTVDGTGHVSGATAVTKADITGLGIPAQDTTYTLSSFGITATAAELNKLDGVTATATELNYVDGVTSNIQTQLNAKASTSVATTSANGLMSAADKTKLNGIASGATANTGTITAVQANGTTVATSGTANIPAASTSAYGVTKLSSSTSSTSTTLAATASAVKAAYDLANTAKTNAATAQSTANSKAPAYQYSTTDLTAGSSPLTTGTLYIVYA